MNLVKLITDQLSSDALAKLSSMLGVDNETIESAVTAAVPSMLAGLGGLASSEDGMRKLTSTLGSLDDSAFGNFDRLLSGDAGGMLQKGAGLLNGLFGESLSGNLATAISRFTGLNTTIVKSLLAYLTPLVLGRVASQWRNQGATPGALKSLFADQKRYIADSLPSGFSLDDVPGLARMSDAGRSASYAAKSAAPTSKSLASSLLPLALLAIAALLAWSFWRGRPQPQEAGVRPAIEGTERVVAMKPVTPDAVAVPEIGQFKQELTDLFKSASTTFAGIKDAASADAALPKLEEFNTHIDTARKTFDAIPAAGRTALGSFLNDQIEMVKQLATKALSLPGLSPRIKSLIEEIVRKLDALPIVERQQ